MRLKTILTSSAHLISPECVLRVSARNSINIPGTPLTLHRGIRTAASLGTGVFPLGVLVDARVERMYWRVLRVKGCVRESVVEVIEPDNLLLVDEVTSARRNVVCTTSASSSVLNQPRTRISSCRPLYSKIYLYTSPNRQPPEARRLIHAAKTIDLALFDLTG